MKSSPRLWKTPSEGWFFLGLKEGPILRWSHARFPAQQSSPDANSHSFDMMTNESHPDTSAWTLLVSWVLSRCCSDVTPTSQGFSQEGSFAEETIIMGSLRGRIKEKPFRCSNVCVFFFFFRSTSVPAHSCPRCNFFPLIYPQTLLDSTAVMFAKCYGVSGALLLSHILTIWNISLLSVGFPKHLSAPLSLG